MWMQDTPTGKVRYYERGKDAKGRTKVFSITLLDKKKSTQKTAAEMLRRKMRRPDASNINFGEACDLYRQYIKRSTRPQTVKTTEYELVFIEKKIGRDTQLSALTAPLVCDLIKGTPASFNRALKRFKAVARWCYQNDLLESVRAFEAIKKMPDIAKMEKLSDKYLEADEAAKLVKEMKSPLWRLLTRFLLLTGMRINEAVALEVEDVTDTISITKTLSPSLRVVSLSAKTDAGNRIIAVQNELRECINDINEYFGKRKHFFQRSNGDYLAYPSYLQYLARNSEKILGRSTTPHTLRHTHVALLAASGMTFEEIARRVGHADTGITKEIYMHVTKKLLKADADAIREIRIL